MALVRRVMPAQTGVIVMAASKGGVGKTTLASALAVRATKDSARVALIDVDPQASLARWWELRGNPDNPQLLTSEDDGAEGVAAMVARARRDGWAWVFIDTPPAFLSVIEPAIKAADLVVIPVQSSAFDLEAVDPVVELCKRAAKPFVFVLNRVFDARSTLLAGAVTYLREDGPVLKEFVSNRQSFMGAVVEGKTGAEITRDEKAREEIDALWRAVKMLAKAAAVAADR